MRLPATLATALLLLSHALADSSSSPPPEDDKSKKNQDPECAVTSPHSENFYDLRKLRRVSSHTPPHTDWFVKGQDYNANFTINICAPVLSDTSYIDDVDESLRGNVSAFYEKNGRMYSIG